jgi:hypothetical protein
MINHWLDFPFLKRQEDYVFAIPVGVQFQVSYKVGRPLDLAGVGLTGSCASTPALLLPEGDISVCAKLGLKSHRNSGLP